MVKVQFLQFLNSINHFMIIHCLMVTLNHFFLVFQHFLQLISTNLFCKRHNMNLLSSYDHIFVCFICSM